MNIVIGEIFSRQQTIDRRSVEYRIFRHGTGGFVKANLSFSRFFGGKSHGLDLQHGAEKAADAQSVDLTHRRGRASRKIPRVRDHAGIAQHLFHHFPFDRPPFRLMIPLVIGQQTEGVGQNIHGFSSVYGIFGDQLRRVVIQPNAETTGGVMKDRNDILGGKRIEIHFPATGTQRGIQFRSFSRCGADENEIGRKSLFKHDADIFRNHRIGGIVIGRFKGDFFILQHFQQFVEEDRIHFADLINKQNAATGFGNKSRFRFGDTGFRQIPFGALIDGVVNRAQQRIGGFPRIPAQGGSVHLHKGSIRSEGRRRDLFGLFQHKAGRRGFAHAGRAVDDHMLRIRRGQFAQKRVDRPILTDDLPKSRRTQTIQCVAAETARRKLSDMIQFFPGFGVFGAALFLQNLQFDLAVIIILFFLHLIGDHLFQTVFDTAAGDHLADFRHQRIDAFFRRSAADITGIVKNDLFQSRKTLFRIIGSDQIEDLQLCTADNDLIWAENLIQQLFQREQFFSFNPVFIKRISGHRLFRLYIHDDFGFHLRMHFDLHFILTDGFDVIFHFDVAFIHGHAVFRQRCGDIHVGNGTEKAFAFAGFGLQHKGLAFDFFGFGLGVGQFFGGRRFFFGFIALPCFHIGIVGFHRQFFGKQEITGVTVRGIHDFTFFPLTFYIL